MAIKDNAGLQDPITPGGDTENTAGRIERLGRQRPEKFTTIWQEIGFCFSLLASMIMAEYFISGFNLILPTLTTALDIPVDSQTWPASAFSLVTGAFLLPFGRLADMYGGYPVFMFGLGWFFLWSLIAGFSVNALMLDFCRALQGLGPAAFLPSGIMLMGSIYRPGPRKNLVFSIYGACSPFGFFTGIFVAGLSGQFLRWGWYFWIGSIMLGMVAVTAVLTVPSDRAERQASQIKMDCIESILGAGPLLTTAWYAPMAIGGLVLALIGGFFLHLLPGTILLGLSGIGYLVSVLLFAIIPENPNYWAYIFPAMLCATLGVDVTYSVTNIFITTNMPRNRQGLAGALINSTVFLGIALFLGFADIAVTAPSRLGLKQSYKVAFWFAVGCSTLSLLLFLVFIRIGKAKSDLTADEKAELEAEVTRIASRESAKDGRGVEAVALQGLRVE
ncbi:hypothetical protein MMC08_007727 [Hypocenomyce scalaris]|nr:hypothetical protein [Hypocenomyce scalaris]